MIDPKTLLSAHVSAGTFTKSSKAVELGINNSLPDEYMERAASYCQNFFEKMRSILGDKPVNIHSGFRSQALNDALPGASKTSDHMRANALDFDCNNRMTLPEAFKTILQSDLKWKQLMIEGVTTSNPQGGWVHGAYDTDVSDDQQKMEVKIVRFDTGTPVYQRVSIEDAISWCDEQS